MQSKLLKTAILAALVGLAGAAAVTPASAREFDRGYHRERDSGWGRDRSDRHDRGDRDDRGGRGFGDGWRRHHHHRFHGWY